MNSISIIIPILNEAENILKLLEHLTLNSSEANISEIIVVDGGSTDGSSKTVLQFMSGRAQLTPHIDISNTLEETKILLLNSKRGRAKQMNLGSEFSTGNILYFLHADSFPPIGFDQLIINEVNKGNHAGCFKMKFESNHLWLKLVGWFTKFSWRVCRGGDQSQFITKELFNDIGRFDEQFTIYEDNDLINKLYLKNQFVVIQKWITTSARRYQTNGIWKLQFHFCIIHIKKWLGSSAKELHNYYQKHIA